MFRSDRSSFPRTRLRLLILCGALFSAGTGANILAQAAVTQAAPTEAAPAAAPYRNPALPVQQRVDDLVSRMTLAEKVSQMQNGAAAIPRLGIPSYDWWSEGLHGVAYSGRATMFPQAIGMAATWDKPLIYQEGKVIGMEARGKYNSAQQENNHAIFYGLDFWSPNVNIFRDPRWGRGQETYGEDPFLTGQLGVQFVKGLQGTNPKYYVAIATPKHFDVHSGPESERHEFNVNVSPHDLQDTYLQAFRATIVDGHADSIMCAYNAVDGVPACASKMLLQKILREDWKFRGYIVSDCGAIGDIADGHKYSAGLAQASADAVHAGTDLSCGGEYANLVQAVQQRLIKESEIDVSLKRLMTARFQLGLFDPAGSPGQPFPGLTKSIVDSPQHAALTLRAAEESMVLLKNDGILPLNSRSKTIAVLGPNAASLDALQGNYHGTPIGPVTALSAFQSLAAQNGMRILYAQGSPYLEQGLLPVPPTSFQAKPLTVEYFPNHDLTGHPESATVTNIDSNLRDALPAPGFVPGKVISARWTGTFTPPAPGDYQFQVTTPQCYPCGEADSYKVWLDGKLVGNSILKGSNGSVTAPFTVHFSDTHPQSFRMEFSHAGPLFNSAIALAWKPPVNALRQQAVELARKADIVVAIVGISPMLEGEEMSVDFPGFSGGDRTSIDLPLAQQQLLEAVAATGKPLVVVLMNGSALAVNWAQQHANAILEAWYPGARGGQAIVDTLVGKNNPAGRLPITFYASTDQLPPFREYSMANRTYRYFQGKPLYGFGYGLSYSHFTYSHLKLSDHEMKAGDPLTVTADVTNTSKIAGDEVAELYLEYPNSSAGPDSADGAPRKALAAFTRVHIAPGATEHLSFTLEARRFSHVRTNGERLISPGEYKVFVGGSQPYSNGEDLSAQVTITGQQQFPN